MAPLIFIAHLPLIRMTRTEDFSIGGGVLTKLPWAQFDSMTPLLRGPAAFLSSFVKGYLRNCEHDVKLRAE